MRVMAGKSFLLNGRRPWILVADEDEVLLKMVERILSHDFDVTAVRDGLTAVEVAADSAPDLTVLDIRMPVMDGIDACRHLRATYDTMPIIILTGHTEDENVRSAFAAGATDFLAKPFSASQLRSRVRAQLLRHRGAHPTRRARTLARA